MKIMEIMEIMEIMRSPGHNFHNFHNFHGQICAKLWIHNFGHNFGSENFENYGKSIILERIIMKIMKLWIHNFHNSEPCRGSKIMKIMDFHNFHNYSSQNYGIYSKIMTQNFHNFGNPKISFKIMDHRFIILKQLSKINTTKL